MNYAEQRPFDETVFPIQLISDRFTRKVTTKEGQAVMALRHGELVAFWEQGWEGRIEFAFQAEDSTMPIFLKTGDRLSIFAEDGTIIWTGSIHWVRRRFWDRHQLDVGIWSYQKQKGVSYHQWLEWFWRKPPLKASLELAE